MDTPQRSQIAGAPLSNSEDSPVFNFINSLSPIQPVKSVHSVQAYTSPGFTSISSIFSSPHVNLQKESRILIKHSYSDTEKQENSSEIGDGNNLCAGVSNAVKLSSCTTVTQENCKLKCSLNEATIDPPEENCKVKCSLDEPQLHSVQYDYGSPNHNITPCYGVKLDLKLGIGSTQVEVVQFAQDGLHGRKSLFAAEVHENHLLEQTKQEVEGCDHEHLVSIEADSLLLLDDSAASEDCADQEKLGNGNANALTLANKDHHENLEYKDENSDSTFSLNLTESVFNDSQKTEPDASFGPCIESTSQDAPVTHCGVVGRQDGTNHTPHSFAEHSQNQTVRINQSQSTCSGINDRVSLNSKVERGFRRRCLVFEVSGASKRNLQDVRSQHLSESLPSKGKLVSDNKHLASLKPGANPPPCVLPGIGLHLNTLASVSKDGFVTHENLTSGKRLISMPRFVGPFPLRTAEEESPSNSLSNEKGLEPIVSEVQDLQIVHDDVAQAPELGSGEEFSGSSPKKKRHKTEGTKENEGCKRCNCKKSKCLKLYCECFAAGMYCVELCSCQGCCNKPIHVEMVLATRKQIECRNPLAFAPKVVHASDTIQKMGEEANKTPASARHKRGCNCKKSSCLKKYCECYQGGVGCSFSCRCEGCKNAFGRKDGIMFTRAEEHEHGEEGNSTCEKEESKSYEDEGQEGIKKYEHQLSEHSLLATPDQTCRTSIKLPFFSSRKPPRFSKFAIGPSPLMSTCPTLRKPENTLPESKSGVCFEAVTESNSSQPINCSPNGKRVSPPHYGIDQSPSRKGCRKLILKSIPSFPALGSSEYQLSHSSCSSSSSSLS